MLLFSTLFFFQDEEIGTTLIYSMSDKLLNYIKLLRCNILISKL